MARLKSNPIQDFPQFLFILHVRKAHPKPFSITKINFIPVLYSYPFGYPPPTSPVPYQPAILPTPLPTPPNTVGTTSGPWLVTVEILAGRRLKGVDANGLSDTYCTLYLGGKKFKTVVVKKDLNPEWRERFSAMVYPTDDHVYIRIKDHNRWAPDVSLGYLDLSISQLQLDVPEDKWHPIQNISTGDLHLRITARRCPSARDQRPLILRQAVPTHSHSHCC